MKQQSFKIIYGQKNIIFSAPHSVNQKRNQRIKPREIGTGDIVVTLANKCSIYGIYKTKDELNDANWDRNCQYKKSLEKLIENKKIKVLVDIHGMAEYREEDICIGINNGENIQGNYSILNNIIEIFKGYGFRNVTVDTPFNASYKYCVSNYISRKNNIPAFQFEINLKYRSIKAKEGENYKKLIEALKKIVNMLEETLEKN